MKRNDLRKMIREEIARAKGKNGRKLVESRGKFDFKTAMNGYYQALLFAPSDSDLEDYDDYSISDISSSSKKTAMQEMKMFIKMVGSDLVSEYVSEYGSEQFGMDFWFTRNGHGTGFFERNDEIDAIYEKNWRKFSTVYTYIEDGEVHTQ
jgi:hypothetical protein